MQIALIDSAPIAFGGGYEMFLLAVGREAIRRGHAVELLEWSPTLVRWLRPPFGRLLPTRLDTTQVRERLGGAKVTPASIRRALKSLRDADVAYLKNEPNEVLVSVLLYLIERKKTPLIIGFHSSPTGRPGTSGRIRAAVYRSSIYGRLLRQAEAIHVLQPEQREFLVKNLRISADSIRVIPNGIDLERFKPDNVTDIDDRMRLLFVGRLEPQKGIDTLIAALHLLPRDLQELTVVTVVGDGPERAIVEAGGGVPPKVDYLGHVHDLEAIYRRHDLLVAPSRWEAFALVPGEALASGLPVVLSDIAANRPYMDCSATRSVSPDNPAQLAHCIESWSREWLSQSTDARAAIRRSARQFAESHLDHQRTLAELVEFLETVAK
jgi:glycosyltransferase involved in cell wall biosynthesis